MFTIVIWDSIFKEDEYKVEVVEGDNTNEELINLVDEIKMTDAM